MYAPLNLLLCLLWLPGMVLGSFQVLVESSANTFKPGDTITYTLVADPIPSGTLGMVLIPVPEGNMNTPRAFTPFSATMAYSPQAFTVTIPTSLTEQSFYTIDAHADSSVESTLLGNSDPFEIEITPPSSTTPIVTMTENVTKTTVIEPASQSSSADNLTTAPAPASQSPSSNSNPPSSSTALPSSSSLSEVSSTSSMESTGVATTTSTSTNESVTPSSSSSNASAGVSAVSLTRKSKSPSTGAIVGAVIGGILVIILLLTFLCVRKRRLRQRRDAVFNMPADVNDSSTIMIQQSASPVLSAGYAHRPFQPNRSQTGISPFVLNEDLSESSSSPEISSAKFREAFGLGIGPQHLPALPSASLSSGESVATSRMSAGVLRSEREHVLSEISALRMGTTTGATVNSNTFTTSATGTTPPNWSDGSSTSAVGSEDDKGSTSEMREKLEQLTNHVRRLESALEQVSYVYDAPPTYISARSQA